MKRYPPGFLIFAVNSYHGTYRKFVYFYIMQKKMKSAIIHFFKNTKRDLEK